MKILFICKASTTMGLGHLIRSKTLAEELYSLIENIKVDFLIIGDTYIGQLLIDFPLKYSLYYREQDLEINSIYDVAIFDALSLDTNIIIKVRLCTRLLVSISPIFNQMEHMDLLINRTKYFPKEINQMSLKKIGGLQYTIIQRGCKKINASKYKAGLKQEKISIAISMGGADAANKTLKLINILKVLELPAVFWVMLGEGYKHSYDELVKEIVSSTKHEIILAKTNHSMWSVLSNTSLLITTSGVTAYEAVYAGLPSIVFYEQEERYFLIKELLENKVIINGGIFSNLNITLNSLITQVIKDKYQLISMHRLVKSFIKDNASKRIYRLLIQQLSKSKT